MTGARYWLLLGAVAYAAGNAGEPPAQATAPAPQAAAASADTPDEGLIEFLGVDDVGDAAWWEFLKKAPPRGKDTPATPPQDAKQ